VGKGWTFRKYGKRNQGKPSSRHPKFKTLPEIVEYFYNLLKDVFGLEYPGIDTVATVKASKLVLLDTFRPEPYKQRGTKAEGTASTSGSVGVDRVRAGTRNKFIALLYARFALIGPDAIKLTNDPKLHAPKAEQIACQINRLNKMIAQNFFEGTALATIYSAIGKLLELQEKYIVEQNLPYDEVSAPTQA